MAPVPARQPSLLVGDEVPPLAAAVLEPSDTATLTCGRCEVTWRGRPTEPCWSCGNPGRRPAGTVLVHEAGHRRD